jgi:hypothetical protein
MLLRQAIETDVSCPVDFGEEGPFLERVLFGRRSLVLVVFAVITVFLGYHALKLRPEASFLRMIPIYHPYIQNFISHQEELKGMGNVVRIAVEAVDGDIFSREYMETLQKINDEVFFIPGVDRGALKSLWTPATRWTEVTEEGFDGGPVIPDRYDGTPKSLDQLRINVLKSGEVGFLVANDLRSSVVHAPLLDLDPDTGQPLDYQQLSERLEAVRTRFQSDKIRIHITGFAKIVGDLIEGASKVILFFAIAFCIMLAFLYFTSRCVRSTAVRAISSIVAVLWQLGLMRLCGYGLNPYSMLVPFLMFALGVSHGIQMTNAIVHEMAGGANKFWAARRAFRSLYLPGLAALATDAIGFAVLIVIRIGVIKDIAVGASIGVVVVAFTDLMLLPILMSFLGASKKAIERARTSDATTQRGLFRWLDGQVLPRRATVSIVVAAVLLTIGFLGARGLKIGDLDEGAPELHPDSRYNLDNAFMTRHYSASSDVLVVMLETPAHGTTEYDTVVATAQLQWELEELEGVKSTITYVDYLKLLNVGYNEGNLKWSAIPRSPSGLDSMAVEAARLLSGNREGVLSPILVSLTDHKAETLQRVVDAVEAFSARHNTENHRFLLAAGNAGIEAATNIEIEKAQTLMTVLVYSVVFLTCLITYRSWRGALCIVLPLFLTSILCEALMARLGIGVKVATLPVIAVGVGIGVDYGIYIYSKMQSFLCEGLTLKEAYSRTLQSTGMAVLFTGTILAIGVGTWVFSPIKFQADMGLLLTFMFVGNMVGALMLLPPLAQKLLRTKPGV